MTAYGTYKHTGIPVRLDDNCFGNVYFVDGTSGHNDNTGLAPRKAFKTIQRAITYQTADNTELGDKIVIFPGSYAESVTGTLSGVTICGAGATPQSVKITPTATNAFAGDMTNSAFRNLTFMSSSSANAEYAACRVNVFVGSEVDNCHFYAGTDTSAVATAFRVGYDEDGGLSGSTKIVMFRSSFTNNVIGTAISGDCFYWGFVMGASVKDTNTNNSSHYSIGSIIGNNRINAELNGIYLNHNQNAGGSTYIMNNCVMGAHLERANCGEAGIKAYASGSENVLLKVIGNMVCADDGIVGFDTHNMMDNLVSVQFANAVGQYPDYT